MPFYDSKALKFVTVCVYMALFCLWNTGSTIFRVKKKDIENDTLNHQLLRVFWSLTHSSWPGVNLLLRTKSKVSILSCIFCLGSFGMLRAILWIAFCVAHVYEKQMREWGGRASCHLVGCNVLHFARHSLEGTKLTWGKGRTWKKSWDWDTAWS